jgi:hypothetical protein
VLSPGDTTIGGLIWYGTYFDLDNLPPSFSSLPPVTDAFTILIFADDAGSPSASPLTAVSVIGDIMRGDNGPNSNADFVEYVYSAQITSVTLLPNTPYWLAIRNTAGDRDNRWFWEYSALTGSLHGASASGAPPYVWGANQNRTMAFALTEPVPEPSTFALFSLGALGMGTIVRRRRLSHAVPETNALQT